MDYYIQGSPDRAKEIKAAFEKLGFDPAGWDCDGAHSVYFTVPGDNKVKSLHISIGKIIMTHPDYQELELPTKPNFKVGDWVVTDYGKVSQVVSVDKDGDGYTLDDGVYFSGSWCDMYHHWTISDVKDGDVLTDGKKIVIFNKFEEPTRKQRIIAYAGLDLSGKLQITEETKDSWRLAADRIMPATKEQRDLLFQKIKEEGYQWDAEKKELRRIIKPKFKVGDWLWHKTKGVFPMMVEGYDEKEGYLMQFTDSKCCYFGRDIIENDYRLWNFEDSKLGDILYDKAYNRIGIFENFGHHPDGGSFNDKTYCYLIIYYDIDDNELYEETHNDMDSSDAVPATKEQRDLLFAKMKEAGYQWDADKKELRKIIKPKFNVGDWITNDYCAGKVIALTDDAYLLDSGQGIPFSCEHNAHLWTIQDAKDGDVLAAHECYVIFKEIDGLNIKCYCAYHYMGFNPTLYKNTLQNKTVFKPANKEQCDLLFKCIKENGYVWDADKKELKKITKHYDIKNFHAGMPVLVRADNNCRWDYSVFSRITGNEDWPFAVCNGVSFTQCIPFEGNETLLGTTDMCNEQYINW